MYRATRELVTIDVLNYVSIATIWREVCSNCSLIDELVFRRQLPQVPCIVNVCQQRAA